MMLLSCFLQCRYRCTYIIGAIVLPIYKLFFQNVCAELNCDVIVHAICTFLSTCCAIPVLSQLYLHCYVLTRCLCRLSVHYLYFRSPRFYVSALEANDNIKMFLYCMTCFINCKFPVINLYSTCITVLIYLWCNN